MAENNNMKSRAISREVKRGMDVIATDTNDQTVNIGLDSGKEAVHVIAEQKFFIKKFNSLDLKMLEEEIQVVQSIYCMSGECQVTDFSGSTQLEVKLKSQKAIEVSVILQFGQFYPAVPPEISIRSSHHSRDTVRELQQSTADLAVLLCGQEMILELLSHLQEKLDSVSTSKSSNSSEKSKTAEEIVTAVLQLDHMRAKNKYVKTIEKWACDFNLTGRLIFMGKLILIVIQGQQTNTKDYILRHKTENVDVDSHGRSCKEKMMKVLCEEKCKKRYSTFQVTECTKEKDLHSVFLKCDLDDIYDKFISPLRGTYF